MGQNTMSASATSTIEPAPSEVLDLLASKEAAAIERAETADRQADQASRARREAHERLSRYGDELPDEELPSHASLHEGLGESEIIDSLRQIADQRRVLQQALKERVAAEAEVLQALASLEEDIEATSNACAQAARSVIELQKAEDRARNAAKEGEDAAGRARRERDRAQARAEQEVEVESRAVQLAESEEANVEQLAFERSVSTRTALEQATLEDEALERASAARSAAERAARQRVATERALERHRQGAGRARRKAARAEAASDAPPRRARPSAPAAEPAPEERAAPAAQSAPGQRARKQWFEAEEAAVPASSQGAVQAELPLEWIDGADDAEADASEISRQPASTEGDDSELWEAALEADEERRRAEAELERLTRSTLEVEEAAQRDRVQEARAIEAERDRYESAARVPAPGSNAEIPGEAGEVGLYAGQDYGWEAQAAAGVQRKLRDDRRQREERSQEGSVEQARASSEALAALTARARMGLSSTAQTAGLVVLSGLLVGVAIVLWLGDGPDSLSEDPNVPASVSSVAPPSPGAELGQAGAAIQRTPFSDPAKPPGPEDDVTMLPPSSPEIEEPPLVDQDEDDVDYPAWRRWAARSPAVGGRPRIAVVIDDMGVDVRASRQVIELPSPLTLAFLPHAARLEIQAGAARVQGHELMAHVPMEPIDLSYDPGPLYLGRSQTDAEIRARLRGHLDRFKFGIVGINNHMGSRFTSDSRGMEIVMGELSRRRMLFLDSRTIRETVGARTAADFGLPYAVRDVFLDHMATPDSRLDPAEIRARLEETEQVARRRGAAVAIGHPHPETVEALRGWIPEAKRKGFVLVPLTSVVRYQMIRRGGLKDVAAEN